MSFQDTLRKNLTPEMFEQVVDALGDDFDYDLVPRSRLNQVIKQRNTLRAQIAGNSQTQGSPAKDPDDDGTDPTSVDVDALRQQFEQQSKQAIQAVKIQYAALDKLRAADVIDPELVWSSNALDHDKLTMDDAGSVAGLDSMIEELKKSKPHLFKSAQQQVPAGTGKDSSDEFEGVTTKEQFLKLEADKQIAFKKAHPDVFKKFMSAIY